MFGWAHFCTLDGRICALNRYFLTNLTNAETTNWCTLMDMAEDLESRLAAVCGVLNAAHAQLVQLVAEAVNTGEWDVPGIRTVEQWVAWKTALSHARAKQTVQIAARSTELPVTMQTFADREVSIDQVAVVAKYAPARNDIEVAGIAKHATVSQLRAKLGSYWKVVVPTEAPGEPIIPETERVDVAMSFFDDDGRWRLHADYSGERGAVPQKAMDEARDSLFKAGNTNVTWADAFEEVCLRSLATVKSVSCSDRYGVIVHINEDGGWLNAGQHLNDSVLKQILSNTMIQAVFERGGRPVNLGRSARVVPNRSPRSFLIVIACAVTRCVRPRKAWKPIMSCIGPTVGQPTPATSGRSAATATEPITPESSLSLVTPTTLTGLPSDDRTAPSSKAPQNRHHLSGRCLRR